MVTPFEYKVLLLVGHRYLRGSAQVRAARRLQKKGLVVLREFSVVARSKTRDGWWATLTPRGKEWLDRVEKQWQEAMARRP